MAADIILVHGYSGSVEDLAPLARALGGEFGGGAVENVRLPGHKGGAVPSFDREVLVAAVAEAVARAGRQPVVLGHSTGGILALAALERTGIEPGLLILAAAPKRVDASSLERWAAHGRAAENVSLTSVANMISCINAVGGKIISGTFPVLLLHGSSDGLVPATETEAWERHGFKGPVRPVLIPGAGHDLFAGTGGELAVDAALRAVRDHLDGAEERDRQTLRQLGSIEPEIERFLIRSPSSERHIAGSPSGLSAAEELPALSPRAGTDPVFANIEITTRCNLRCAYCARTMSGRQGRDMTKEAFVSLLGLLPHAYRVTLVGLGETLLHPDVADFVALAWERGRRVALVTNAMLLDRQMSRELLDAGLESIAFSIDGPDQAAASEVRAGTDLDRVIGNIRQFIELARNTRPVSTAVFAAVSMRTAERLGDLVDVVAGLGVHVLMLSDLNFAGNHRDRLWNNIDEPTAGRIRKSVARAFGKNLPVLSVRALEEFGLWKRYEKFLLFPPEQLYQRSAGRTWCFSPWQTVPVAVDGEITLCDCRPDMAVGNILERPLGEIWNGEAMMEHRRRMLGPDPPEECRICPRF